jgi:hypothetical protein
MGRKVAIVGTADTCHMTPYDDPEFEIWGVNNGYLLMKRWTRWFELHPITHDGSHFYRRGQREFRGTDMDTYMKKLAELNCPVYMQQHWDQVPQSCTYPLADVAQVFGSQLGWFHQTFDGTQPSYDVYLTNTISYMMALAILEGFEEIHVYGVDMAVSSEYGVQRPSCEFFLGYIVGKGIKLYLPPQCDLLKARTLYAYGEQVQNQYELKMKNTKQSLQKRLNEVNNVLSLNTQKQNQYIGAIAGIDEMMKNWSVL